jgi:hypothetical protein
MNPKHATAAVLKAPGLQCLKICGIFLIIVLGFNSSNGEPFPSNDWKHSPRNGYSLSLCFFI